jgi:hypothetical protein
LAVSFAKIENRFERIFGFIQKDLEQLLSLEAGGNFAIATLAACACEPLARYWLGSGEGADAFARLLPSGAFQTIAKTLYNCLRNGFVHHYGCSDMDLGSGVVVQLAISRRKRAHLSVTSMDGRPTLVLNAEVLCRGLFRLFETYREVLENDADARDHFIKTFNGVGAIKVQRASEVTAWKEILSSERR